MWLFIACGSLLLAPQPLPRGLYPAARHAGVKLSVAEPPPKPIESSSFPAIFTSIEKSLEAVAGNPQLLLEAVVGIDKGTAKYDRDNILDYFKARPQLMVARAFDFLMAFRRVKAAWDLPESSGVDRGATLRAELAALGPVAVKVGQTLSQRPDILPEDVCESLKGLQTSNEPFPNEEAYRVIAEDFNATGPIAPGIPVLDGYDPNGPYLFKSLTKDCIASASLGQVYRGELHDGTEVAVKVQRPSALRQCLLDGSVIIVALKAIQGRYWNGDLLAIFDLVAGGIVQGMSLLSPTRPLELSVTTAAAYAFPASPRLVAHSYSYPPPAFSPPALPCPPALLSRAELDFRNEAKNAAAFKRSLSFLGYVDVPVTLPELTTRRAMAMEWVHGRHLSSLTPEEAMRMTYMSCEAVTAGLVLTGLVHADPHEGNIMLADDGRLVFLDFGLMSVVEEDIMEAFASGIQCVLSKDYRGLVKAFVDTGFIGNPIEWRAQEADPWQTTHPDGDDLVEIMAKDLKDRMEAAPGGGSRFGALSVVLGDMGFFWQMYTPPYIILLIRTFLTLEGIAGQVDPNFNIYEVALPWAVQRALSPSTISARETLRQSLLTGDNKFQWERVDMLIEQQQAEEAEAKEKAEQAKATKGAAASDGSLPEAASARARLMAQEANKAELDPVLAAAGAEAQAAQAATPLEALTTVLGSPNGGTLRRVLKDIDSTALMLQLASPAARPARRLAASKLSAALYTSLKDTSRKALGGGRPRGRKRDAARRFIEKFDGKLVPTRPRDAVEHYQSAASLPAPQEWPSSPEASRLEARASARAKKTGLILFRTHVDRQVAAGWKGLGAMGALVYVTLRVGLAALAQTIFRASGKVLTKLLPAKLMLPVASATSSLLGRLGGELSALGASVDKMAQEVEAKKTAMAEQRATDGKNGDDAQPAAA